MSIARAKKTHKEYLPPILLPPSSRQTSSRGWYISTVVLEGRARTRRARLFPRGSSGDGKRKRIYCSRWGASRMKRNASAHSRRPGTSRRYSTSKLRKPARQTVVNKKRRRDARRNERRGLERGCLPSEERVRGGVRGRAGTGNETTLLGDGRGVHKSVCCLRNAP